MSQLRVPVTSQDHIQGDGDARVVLVEYADFQCPYCRQAFSMVKQLQRRFGKDLALVFRSFPLVEVHPQALNAAVFAEFAGTKGKFWEAHDALFENQDLLGADYYETLAGQLGLSLAELQSAAAGGVLAAKVERSLEGGVRSGVNGTPTFFINGTRFDGGFDTLFRGIEEAMGGT